MGHVLGDISGAISHIPLPSLNGSLGFGGICILHSFSGWYINKTGVRYSRDTDVSTAGSFADGVIPASLRIKYRQEYGILSARDMNR